MTEEAVSVFNATLVRREDQHDSQAIFHFKPNEGDLPEFVPGQFCTIALPSLDPPNPDRPARKRPKLTRRAYSIASPPTIRDHVELLIVKIPDGKLTPRLWDLKPGDPVYMDPKIRGEFSMEGSAADKNVIMIGTGTGIAPFISMLREYEKEPRWNKLVMISGCRYISDLGYDDYLRQKAAEIENFYYLPCVTREADDVPFDGVRGRVYSALDQIESLTDGFTPNAEDTEIYLCGSPQMIDDCQVRFEGQGFTSSTHKVRGNLHFERYW